MSWSEERARQRIRRFADTVPEGDIVVEDFAQFLTEQAMAKASTHGATFSARDALMHIPRNRAITTHGAHVYANLLDFNAVLVDAGRETEASHRRALEFLNAHYAGCDSLIAEFDLQRVDFHGSRLHAVVVTPEGDDYEHERVRKAIAFAAAFRALVERLGEEYPEFQTGVRIGIDSGPAVAIDGGKKDEPEPLFVGSPANYAAKLAAGDEPGLFVSARIERARTRGAFEFGGPQMLTKDIETAALSEAFTVSRGTVEAASQIDIALQSARQVIQDRGLFEAASSPSFSFHYHQPPLKTIDFGDHPPSNAIRMSMASLFADIDGFTAYVDQAIATGRIAEAVANLHVVRAEMAAVVRDDFGGRKVRFIGDCVHAVIAEGSSSQTNDVDTVRQAVLAAGGIRSSFELCREMLPGIDNLGIAIGIELGQTPICRVGLRGTSSVRCAASKATCVSEAVQQECSGSETAIGDNAFANGPAVAREVFGSDRKVENLTFPNAELHLGTMASPYVMSNQDDPMRAHQEPEPMRAHSAS